MLSKYKMHKKLGQLTFSSIAGKRSPKSLQTAFKDFWVDDAIKSI